METRRPYSTVKYIAEKVKERLEPYCEPGRCIIAGSVRRRQMWCGDIEIVCQPITIEESERDLFGVVQERFRINEWSDAVVGMFKGKVTVGDPTYGRYTSGLLDIKPSFGGGQMQVDIFMPQPHDFYRQLAIRTGSADFSRVIETAWVKSGWRGTEDGLRCVEDYLIKGKEYVVKKGINPTLPPEWASELEFFEWLGMAWTEPELR